MLKSVETTNLHTYRTGILGGTKIQKKFAVSWGIFQVTIGIMKILKSLFIYFIDIDDNLQ